MLTVACMCDCFAIWRSGASTWLCSLNSRLCRWMVKLNMQLGQMTVQMRVEHSTKFIFYVTCMCKQGQTCRNEGWNTVQYSFVMQLVWMTLNLCRWGVEQYSIHLLCSLCRWCRTCADEDTIFIYYACSLCRWRPTCADEWWNTVQLCNLYKLGVVHSTMFI